MRVAVWVAVSRLAELAAAAEQALARVALVVVAVSQLFEPVGAAVQA